MWLMKQHHTPDTFVISTGKTHTVREFLEISSKVNGLDSNIDKYVDFDSNFVRPSKVDLFVGNSNKALEILGLQIKFNLQKLLKIIIENGLKIKSSRS
jgi:GDPmannose 4,6-dehydratase